MNILIKYCQIWNYKPTAASLAAAIKKATGTEAKIEPGSRGQFDVFVDGKLIFSKHEEGRFPEHEEVLRALPRA